jgi:acetyl esterase/lipase
MFMHGGGWTNGSKNSSLFAFLPFLEMGWAVVNVEYRLADVALAPAAVEDCRCALRWIYQNAKQYKFDLDNIVTTGQSAGGHLALATGMIPESAGLDRQCPGRPAPHLDDGRAWDAGDDGRRRARLLRHHRRPRT